MKESHIERAVCRHAEKLGCICIKQLGLRGVPDRLILGMNGNVLFIEFKQKGEKPRPDQQRMIEKLQRLGQNVMVIDDVDTGKGIIDAFWNA